MPHEGLRYLVVIQLARVTPQRLQYLVPDLRDILTALSTEPIEQAFRSSSGDLFAYLIRTTRAAQMVRAAIESPATKPDPILDGADHLMIIEIGTDAAWGVGFTRVGTWLQRH